MSETAAKTASETTGLEEKKNLLLGAVFLLLLRNAAMRGAAVRPGARCIHAGGRRRRFVSSERRFCVGHGPVGPEQSAGGRAGSLITPAAGRTGPPLAAPGIARTPEPYQQTCRPSAAGPQPISAPLSPASLPLGHTAPTACRAARRDPDRSRGNRVPWPQGQQLFRGFSDAASVGSFHLTRNRFFSAPSQAVALAHEPAFDPAAFKAFKLQKVEKVTHNTNLYR